MITPLLLLLPLIACTQDLPTKTIIDILNSSPQFSEFLNLLQKHELVPLINTSYNSTLIAPINSAFSGVDKDQITKDQLLYHFINDTVYTWELGDSTTHVYKSYLDDGSAPISVNLDDGINGYSEFVDYDLLGSRDRGVVHSVLDLLDIPGYLDEMLYINNDLRKFSETVGKGLKNCVVFGPVNRALEDWISEDTNSNSTSVVFNYLKSPFGAMDRKNLLNRHVAELDLQNLESLPATITLRDQSSAVLHKNLSVEFEGRLIAASSDFQVARNGLFITLDDVLAPSCRQFLDLNEEKFILGLGGHSLVKTMQLYGLHQYIDGSTTTPQVIIVPNPGEDQMAISMDPTKLVLYQFLDGELPHNSNYKLIDSKMSLRSGKYPQRVHYNKRSSGEQNLNWELIGSTEYKLGLSTFYTSWELLSAPPSLSMVLGPLLTSSYSFTFLDKLDRLHLPISDSWTMFIPTRDAWEKNMLLMYYINRNITALECVFNNLVLREPVYTDSKAKNVSQYDFQRIELTSNERAGTFKLNNSEISEEISVDVSDVLFDNGVVHIVSSVPIPKSLEVSSEDLIIASKRSYFIKLLEAAKLDDVLDPHANFTMLVPPDNDLKRANYTVNTDLKKLRQMLMLHLLPNNPMSSVLRGDTVITMNDESLAVQVIDDDGTLFGLAPVSGRGQRVLLYEYGYSNGVVAGGSTVVLIDRYIAPEWILPERFGLRKGTYAIIGLLFGIVCAVGFILAVISFFTKESPMGGYTHVEEPYRDDANDSNNDSSDHNDSTNDNNSNSNSNTNDNTTSGTGHEDPHTPQRSGPIETPAVSEGRTFGRHLNLDPDN